MSIPKAIFIVSLSLFAVIGGLALIKKKEKHLPEDCTATISSTAKIDEGLQEQSQQYLKPVLDEVSQEEADHVWRLFTKGKEQLPIVETIRYKSRVSWLDGRPAWITDYAAHFSTSRHFIARSLNGKEDYDTQKVSVGDQFNILKKDVSFYLVVDLSRCKLWFYALDTSTNKRHLLKTYKVGLGRFDEESCSGLLTPKGEFSLGDKVAIYRKGTVGYFQNREEEMVRIFGTRWIPFSEKLSSEEKSPCGYGLHGAPWAFDAETGAYNEDTSTIGSYTSDGSIILAQHDMEELYAIVITRPTTLVVVTDFLEAEIPGDPVAFSTHLSHYLKALSAAFSPPVISSCALGDISGINLWEKPLAKMKKVGHHVRS